MAAAGVLPASVHAAATYADRVRERILPNGLKIILLEDHKAPVATLQIWYRAGSRNEQLGKTGLAHLLEHLMFKGTDKVGPEEYSKIIQRNGGNENAFTTNDSTTYFATIASDRLGVVVDLEADRMHNLKFDEAQFTPEHKVVMEERRLRTDNNPVSALFEQVSSVAYSAHPYQWPVIGWMNDLRQLTRDDALAWYRTYYAPSNAFVVCAGDFSSDDLLAQIERAFGAIPPAPPPPSARAIEPLQQGERRAVLQRTAELPFVVLAYHVPNVRDADSAALEVLSAVLSGGKSARLHQHLVYEQRLAREVGANYDLTSVDPGLFYVFGQPLPGKAVARLEKQLLTEVERLEHQPVGEHELVKAKNGLEADTVVAQDSLFYQAMLLAEYELSGDWRRIDDYLPAIRSVSADDVRRAAAAYLTAGNRTVAVLEPLPAAPGQPVPRESVPQEMVH